VQGFYCEMEGLGNVSGPCDPGYYCSVTNLTEVRPTGEVAGSGPCPKGHWCARATVGVLNDFGLLCWLYEDRVPAATCFFPTLMPQACCWLDASDNRFGKVYLVRRV
jgi:hypothetical protein